jgi:hypothetical protein
MSLASLGLSIITFPSFPRQQIALAHSTAQAGKWKATRRDASIAQLPTELKI